ncbi:hypothetical protein ACYF6T_15855 [Streptomyces sp. 7R007]
MNRHLRKATLVTAAITAGLLMTACQNGSTNTGTSSSHHTSTTKTTSPAKTSGSSKTASKTSKSSGRSTSAGASAQHAGTSEQGVNASVSGGTVIYLAPGKYIAHVPGKTDQAFYVADDTAVYGAGRICGSPRSEARPRCTLDQLETATKKAAVTADVTIRNGVATVVRERHDAGATYDGTVSYLAPGKYTVTPKGGTAHAFYVADDTAVRGAGTICGSPMSESTYTCTLDQLEAAAKKGVAAQVVVVNGVATSVTEDR